MTSVIRRLAILTISIASVTAALAGGDDYDAASDTEGKGPVYFGFVRDSRGSPVPSANVKLIPKSGEPVVLKSNVLGLYRSHISKDVKPDDVQLQCEKQGYAQIDVLRRNAPGSKDMNIETNCTLRKQ